MTKVTKNKTDNTRLDTKKILVGLVITAFIIALVNNREAFLSGMKAGFHEIVALP